MKTKTKDGTQLLFTLTDEQITLHRQPAINQDDLMVTTQMQSGTCVGQPACESSGGTWVEENILGKRWKFCSGGSCEDTGSGDWD